MAISHVSPRWEDPRTVAGFVSSPPNAVLIEFARQRLFAGEGARCVDIGCGAGRNTFPLADLGYDVAGTDLAVPMLDAARKRAAHELTGGRVQFVHAPMTPLPLPSGSFDLVVAHGIWNLARSGAEFRSAVAEAGRLARPGAGLFLFTFSRNTLPPGAVPDPGETFVFSSWNGEPQVFLTEAQVIEELERAGFVRASAGPLTEYNRPRPGEVRAGGPPVIYEGTFRKVGNQ